MLRTRMNEHAAIEAVGIGNLSLSCMRTKGEPLNEQRDFAALEWSYRGVEISSEIIF